MAVIRSAGQAEKLIMDRQDAKGKHCPGYSFTLDSYKGGYKNRCRPKLVSEQCHSYFLLDGTGSLLKMPSDTLNADHQTPVQYIQVIVSSRKETSSWLTLKALSITHSSTLFYMVDPKGHTPSTKKGLITGFAISAIFVKYDNFLLKETVFNKAQLMIHFSNKIRIHAIFVIYQDGKH